MKQSPHSLSQTFKALLVLSSIKNNRSLKSSNIPWHVLSLGPSSITLNPHGFTALSNMGFKPSLPKSLLKVSQQKLISPSPTPPWILLTSSVCPSHPCCRGIFLYVCDRDHKTIACSHANFIESTSSERLNYIPKIAQHSGRLEMPLSKISAPLLYLRG